MMFELNELVSVHIIPVLDNVEWKKTARRNCDRVDSRVEESGCGTSVGGGGVGGDKGGTPLFHSTLNYFEGLALNFIETKQYCGWNWWYR